MTTAASFGVRSGHSYSIEGLVHATPVGLLIENQTHS